MSQIFNDLPKAVKQYSDFASDCIDKKLYHNFVSSTNYDGSSVNLQGKKLNNFFSCSYLGLEVDPRLKEAATKAIQDNGIQFSSSRSFISLDYYRETEELLGHILGGEVMITPTTTLGHYSIMPLLIQKDDVVILDQQVHNSIYSQTPGLQQKGVEVVRIKHNNMERLEELIKQYQGTKKKIWFMADAVYSMFGDFAPFKILESFLKKYDQFHLYIDDAHGMSWTGKHGKGTVLEEIGLHDKMVFTTSLSKGFGCGGGAVCVKDPRIKHTLLSMSNSIIFSGPIQTPILAALKESAHIHLSPAFDSMQKEIEKRMVYTQSVFKARGLPLISNDKTPINFLGVKDMGLGFDLFNKLQEEGYFACLSIYPAVPKNASGLRFTTSLHQDEAMIDGFAEAVDYHLNKLMAKYDVSMQQIHKAFKIDRKAA